MTWIKAHIAEALTACAWLAGWSLVTYGLIRLDWWAISGGLLCISLGGWRLLFVVLRDGLYLLTRNDNT